ncbi:MAG: hypothetical protein HYS04_12970, partial [Acidobacteria bacterium]|nr:hypothetical protein [Acidobacteriota bacterium]
MHRLLVAAVVSASGLCAQSFQERAETLSREIAARHMPYGTILDPVFASPASGTIVGYSRCGDSAIWTGHYLAAESFRYRITRSPEALEAARRGLRGIQSLVDVTGADNVLARCLFPADSPYSAALRAEESNHGQYAAKLGGADYVWIGHTSRDQYLGVFFGLSVAYELIEDSAMRATAADLVTRLVTRLLDKGWAIVMPDGSTSTVFWL